MPRWSITFLAPARTVVDQVHQVLDLDLAPGDRVLVRGLDAVVQCHPFGLLVEGFKLRDLPVAVYIQEGPWRGYLAIKESTGPFHLERIVFHDFGCVPLEYGLK